MDRTQTKLDSSLNMTYFPRAAAWESTVTYWFLYRLVQWGSSRISRVFGYRSFHQSGVFPTVFSVFVKFQVEIWTHASFYSRPTCNWYVIPSETATLHSKWATPKTKQNYLWHTPDELRDFVTPLVIYVSHLLRFGAPLFWGLPCHFFKYATPYIELHIPYSYWVMLYSY